jgi:hypothetical protein
MLYKVKMSDGVEEVFYALSMEHLTLQLESYKKQMQLQAVEVKEVKVEEVRELGLQKPNGRANIRCWRPDLTHLGAK